MFISIVLVKHDKEPKSSAFDVGRQWNIWISLKFLVWPLDENCSTLRFEHNAEIIYKVCNTISL